MINVIDAGGTERLLCTSYPDSLYDSTYIEGRPVEVLTMPLAVPTHVIETDKVQSECYTGRDVLQYKYPSYNLLKYASHTNTEEDVLNPKIPRISDDDAAHVFRNELHV